MDGDADNGQPQQDSAGPDEIIRPAQFQPPTHSGHKRRITLRAGSVLTAAVLLLCAFSAWFVMTARSVYVQTRPAGANVHISGLKLRLADHYLIRPGGHSLKITAKGYYPVNAVLEVGDQASQQKSYDLKPLPGRLQITTSPVNGARVLVDGVARGESPVQVRSLEPGRHDLRIVADRYLPFTSSIDIKGRGIEQKLAVQLKPAWADVSVSSEPAGADVLLDDKRVGQTPIKTQILQGVHQLRIQRSGYKPWVQRINITAGQPLRFPPVTLQPADAVVNLSSEPEHASITVNGEFQGLTPLQLDLTAGTTAKLDLFKDGYKKASRTVKARSGQSTDLKVRLTPVLVPIALSVMPADAKLYVDGTQVNGGSRTLKLTATRHHIRVHKDGYVDYDRTVTMRPGQAQQLHVVLKTVAQAKFAAARPEITTAGGQTLKLFRPDQVFTMGAPRREPGRRANEILHNVELKRPFYLGLREVTNREYKAFRPGHSSGSVKQHSLDGPDQPVVQVGWEDAALYCNWLSRRDHLKPFYRVKDNEVTGFDEHADGYRLPTETEWAWAARAQAGGKVLKFPWGARMPPHFKSGNYADIDARGLVGDIIQGYEDGFAVTAPPGSFPPNAKGLYDMGGNVSEWVNDYYGISIPANSRPQLDPMGPASGQHHVIRGASWASGTLTELRLSFRDYGIEGRDDVGFRIARYLD